MQHKTIIMRAVQCCIFGVLPRKKKTKKTKKPNKTKQPKPKQTQNQKQTSKTPAPKNKSTEIWTILQVSNYLMCFISRTEISNKK